jgi:hypothetical protein
VSQTKPIFSTPTDISDFAGCDWVRVGQFISLGYLLTLLPGKSSRTRARVFQGLSDLSAVAERVYTVREERNELRGLDIAFFAKIVCIWI